MANSKEKGLKIYKFIKLPIFIIGGILLFIFSETFLENECKLLPFLVGGIICFYGIEGIILTLVEGEVKEELTRFMNQLITLLLGIIVLFLVRESEHMIEIVSVLWSVWAIMRESEEINEKVLPNLDCIETAVINCAESIVVIVFSVMLIINPGKHHIHSHIILLGVELILEVIWPLFMKLERLLKNKKASDQKE